MGLCFRIWPRPVPRRLRYVATPWLWSEAGAEAALVFAKRAIKAIRAELLEGVEHQRIVWRHRLMHRHEAHPGARPVHAPAPVRARRDPGLQFGAQRFFERLLWIESLAAKQSGNETTN